MTVRKMMFDATLAYSGIESGSNLDRGVLNPSPG